MDECRLRNALQKVKKKVRPENALSFHFPNNLQDLETKLSATVDWIPSSDMPSNKLVLTTHQKISGVSFQLDGIRSKEICSQKNFRLFPILYLY
jgi:hypothetical protein